MNMIGLLNGICKNRKGDELITYNLIGICSMIIESSVSVCL